ncbi:hypothetical protein [Ciceribacter azotifigens]
MPGERELFIGRIDDHNSNGEANTNYRDPAKPSRVLWPGLAISLTVLSVN